MHSKYAYFKFTESRGMALNTNYFQLGTWVSVLHQVSERHWLFHYISLTQQRLHLSGSFKSMRSSCAVIPGPNTQKYSSGITPAANSV